SPHGALPHALSRRRPAPRRDGEAGRAHPDAAHRHRARYRRRASGLRPPDVRGAPWARHHRATAGDVGTDMKVSVLVLAYNHERFIGHTLESVLSQQVGFDWEVVIGEDCSTDGTAAVVRRYANRHPERIRVLPRERNLGMHRNFADTWAACRGQYIAILEGDDYWTSPTKLSRQAAFLDARPDYTECFTDVEVFHEDGSRPRWRHRPPS